MREQLSYCLSKKSKVIQECVHVHVCVPADQSPEEEEEGRASVSNHPKTEESRVIIKVWKREKIQSHEDAALAAFPLVCTCGGGETRRGGRVGVWICRG